MTEVPSFGDSETAGREVSATVVTDGELVGGVTVDDGITSGGDELDAPFLETSDFSSGGVGLIDADIESEGFTG